MILTTSSYFNLAKQEQWYDPSLSTPALRWREWYVLPRFVQANRACPSLADVAEEPHVAARINHGRWIADCPVCAGSSTYADPTIALFVCPECLNAAAGYVFLPVVFPEDREDIEAALAVRWVTNANWTPGETVEDLLAENVEQGVS